MFKTLKKLFDNEYKELYRFSKLADQIDALDEEMSKLSDKKLASYTDKFKKRLEEGETLDDILVEAFAVAREAAYRCLGMKPFYCQLLGGLAIHYGNIAEMKTGEGKTLTCVLPAYLNALTGKGVHIVTVNEFLSTRDSEWMGSIFKFLGLTVGLNLRELSFKEKQEAYNCDILYSTNNELGFDYLRDNMVVKKENRVQRPLNYCIVDEVDSILIDEARTPLIISGGVMQSANLYIDADRFVKSLKENEDYIMDEKSKAVSLTDEGSRKAEEHFHLDNLYDINNTALVHHINQALKANYAMSLDVDYVVQDGEVIIVDQFTGRLMKGRAFSDGLHQAIEAKEGVKELGGLCVIGSERHESRRIDNQLRGRSGRQGDPGFTQFFVSFEDDLLVRFGSDRYKDMLKNLGFTGDMAIQNKMFSKTVESAQRKVEGNNFDIRKQLLNYDDVMNNQREIIYGKRNEILDNDSIHETVLNGFKEYISDIVNSHLVESNKLKENDYSEILEAVNENLLRKYRINLSEINGKHPSEVIDLIYENALKDYEEKLEDIPEEVRDEFEKAISLRVIDNYWMEHISTMSHLRDGIGLRGYANTSPLQAYTMEGYQLFDEMIAKINRDISIYLLKSEIRQNIERKQVAKNAITNDSKDHAKVQKKSTKVGRNDPCPCGSGKKYKNCCGK